MVVGPPSHSISARLSAVPTPDPTLRSQMPARRMSIIAFVTDPVPVRSILSYLHLPTRPPPLSPARAPPQTDLGFDQSSGFDPTDAEPIPQIEFDQSLPD